MSAATSATGRRRLAGAAALGAAATTAGIALTSTSGWLVVRASERPAILTLLTAIVAVRTFGIARPLLRYAERLRSHDASLRDLARRRAETYARLVPLTPARLGRRRRSELLTAVVDDLTDVVEGQVRVVVPVAAAALAGLAVTVVTAVLAPPVGGVVAVLVLATALVGAGALRQETVSQQALLGAREEVVHVSQLVAAQGTEVRAAQAGGAVIAALDAAQAEVARATSRQSRGRSATAGAVLVLVGAATVSAALLAAGLD
ncbi:MAG: thiol reductant ABC exporter subunit CydC, partial [Lapillicoccus sp.]